MAGSVSVGRITGFVRVALAALVVSACVGCATSPPVRAIRAARYYAAGTEALERGEPRKAIEELERAARLMPEASEIQNHLGLAYWADARPEDALRALSRAVELDCDNEAARINLERLQAVRRVSPRSVSHGG